MAEKTGTCKCRIDGVKTTFDTLTGCGALTPCAKTDTTLQDAGLGKWGNNACNFENRAIWVIVIYIRNNFPVKCKKALNDI